MTDNTPLHVVFFLRNLTVGGAEKSLVLAANGLAARGHAVVLMVWQCTSPQDSGLKSLVDNRITIIELGVRSIVSAAWQVKLYLHKHKPDIIIACLLKANFAAALGGWWARAQKKILVTEHSNTQRYLQDKSFPAKQLCHGVLYVTHRLAGHIASVNPENSKLVEKVTRLRTGTVITIPNPVYLPQATSSHAMPYSWWSSNVPVILAVGRLVDVKNYPFLLNVFSTLVKSREAQLCIIGEGPLYSYLHQLIDQMGLSRRACILPHQSELSRFYQRADVLAVTSKHESFSMVMLEAFSEGTPVVAVDCPTGPRSVSVGGTLARLIPPNDEEAFLNALIATLDEGKPAALQNRLRAHAANYTVEKIAEHYEQIIRATL